MKTGMNKYETNVFPCIKCFSDNCTIVFHYLSLLENAGFVATVDMGINAQVTYKINRQKCYFSRVSSYAFCHYYVTWN